MTTHVESFQAALARAAHQAERHQIIADLDSPQVWRDEELLAALASVHEGPLCLLVFHPNLHPEFTSFVASGGPDLASRTEILFLVYTPAPMPGPRRLSEILEQGPAQTRDRGLLGPVQELFGEAHSLRFPGLLFFRLDDRAVDHMLFVPAPITAETDELGVVFRAITDTAVTHWRDPQWSHKTGFDLSKKGIPFDRREGKTLTEKTLLMLRQIWRSRSDLATVLGAV